MKCQSLCSRSVLVGAVVFFLLPLLTGCVELYVTYFHDDTWEVEAGMPLLISCEGALTGIPFNTPGYCVGAGRCYMPLLFPLDVAYYCRFEMDACCEDGVFIDMSTPMVYNIPLGCGKYNGCYSPY